MSINLLAVTPKHERRVRLSFDNTLAAGAFGTSTATLGLYAVTSQDAAGPSPAVVSALVVASSPTVVELALGADLVAGALYAISAIGVPCTDTSVTSAAAVTALRWAANLPRPNQEVPADDYASLLYGIDVIHTGTDFLEQSDGDLASASGLPCVEGDLRRGSLGNGLPWAPTWGGMLRGYIDGVTGALPDAKSNLTKFFLADDRVKTATVTLYTDSDPTHAYFDCSITLIGSETLQTFSVQIPNT